MTPRESVHRERCGVTVRHTDEACARAQGHRHQHRTREAMDHQMRMATGHIPGEPYRSRA